MVRKSKKGTTRNTQAAYDRPGLSYVAAKQAGSQAGREQTRIGTTIRIVETWR